MGAAAFVMNQRRVSSQGGNTDASVRSLVVLPFENLTGDAEQVYFVDAVTDALTTHLAQVEGLDVISRTSARRYQRPLKRLSEIGEELRVDAVVEGIGGAIRITCEGHGSAHPGRDRSPHLGPKLRKRVGGHADSAATDCKGRCCGGGAGRATGLTAGLRQVVDPQAYEAYVKGLTAVGTAYEDNRRAVGYFEEAIARQPDFAQAYAELASRNSSSSSAARCPRATPSRKPKRPHEGGGLDDTLARAHLILGQILSISIGMGAADAAFGAPRLRAPGAQRVPGVAVIAVRAERPRKRCRVGTRAHARPDVPERAIEVGTAYREADSTRGQLEEFRRGRSDEPRALTCPFRAWRDVRRHGAAGRSDS